MDVTILVTQKCVGDSRPLPSAREAQCTVSSENKLRRRTWQLFLFPQRFKKEKETEARGFYPNVLVVGKRRRSLEMTNEPNVSSPHCCSLNVLSCGTDQV